MTGSPCHDDAAYLLGALSPADRQAFETHLVDCSACQRSVRELAGVPGLMSKVQPEDFSSPQLPPPPTLLATLTREVRRERTRRRWFVGAIAAAAAVTVLAIGFGVHEVMSSGPTQTASVAMSPVTDTPVNARVQLNDKPWGTEIDLLCTYKASRAYPLAPTTYALVVTDRAGASRQLATWKVVPNGVSKVTGSIGWSRADIARVEIRTLDGSPILRLNT
jgi:hypothetical protein